MHCPEKIVRVGRLEDCCGVVGGHGTQVHWARFAARRWLTLAAFDWIPLRPLSAVVIVVAVNPLPEDSMYLDLRPTGLPKRPGTLKRPWNPRIVEIYFETFSFDAATESAANTVPKKDTQARHLVDVQFIVEVELRYFKLTLLINFGSIRVMKLRIAENL